MRDQAIAIRNTALVTSVGLSAPASCAAIRAKISNPSETRFIDSSGEWLIAHQVPLEKPWRGRTKLAKMAALAIDECLDEISHEHWQKIPLLLCVAEHNRPGRFDGLEDALVDEIERELETEFHEQSAVITLGRVGVSFALSQAQRLIFEGGHAAVLVAATDTLVTWPTLSVYEREDRLLTGKNSNGFLPGEGAGALLITRPSQCTELRCHGIGFGMETAHVNSEEPLRAEGLSTAIKAALSKAECEMHDIDYRITDLSGEQYYFKEAALALSRTLRKRKEEFDIWHPAECIGEAGATSGIATIAVADAACRKDYGPGPNILVHAANDDGNRAAAVLQYGAA